MLPRALKWCLLSLCVLLLGACCSGAHCPERASGGDWPRTKAKWTKRFGKVINDKVSYPKLDRTDWRYVVLSGSGKLTVQLHWDSGKNKLDLSVWDEMGIKIQDGRVWGTLGLKSVVAIEHAGRYYVRVRAAGDDDESSYALRIFFKPEIAAPECDPCDTVGEKKCLGNQGFQVCEKKSAKCTGWSNTFSCPENMGCEGGGCVKLKVEKPKPPPRTGCRKGARRCSGRNTYMVCKRKKNRGKWSSAIVCPGSQVCSSGKCKTKAAPKPPPPKGCVAGKVISMYIYQGKPTLHIELPAGHAIKPGNRGSVLQGGTKKKLANGGFKVRKVSGNYCVATTTLSRLGQNRKVCITPSK